MQYIYIYIFIKIIYIQYLFYT